MSAGDDLLKHKRNYTSTLISKWFKKNKLKSTLRKVRSKQPSEEGFGSTRTPHPQFKSIGV